MPVTKVKSVWTSGSLSFRQGYGATDGQVQFGVDDTGLDVKMFGATSGAYLLWDESADSLILAGGAIFAPAGTSNFTGNVNFGVDATGVDVTFFGDTTAYKVWWDQNGDTNGAWYFGADTKGVLVNMYGDVTGCGVFWNPSTDTNGTLTIGGSGGSKGNDLIVYGAANGSSLQWDQSANGLIVTGAGLHATTGRVAKFVGTVAAPAHADGYGAVEIDVTASGTFAGPYVAAASTWINVAGSAVPGANIVTPHNDGIYVPTGITASSATMIMGGRFHYVADDGANPGSLYLFSTNIYSNALTALLHVNAIGDLGGSTGAQTGNDYKIPLLRDVTAGQTWYINVYHT